jgi:hypothetical protein
MSFGNFLRGILPIAATALGGPVGGALAGGVLGMLNARSQANAQQQAGQQAGQTAMGGFNYLAGSPIGTQYLPAGGAAIGQQQALLGLGGDPAAAAQAFQNYQNSTGFAGQMQAGQNAITGSAAARGLLGSGSTLRALQAQGQQLGQQSFNNYLGQLGGVANMGLQAGGMVGQAAQAGAGQAAGMQYGGAMGAADTRASGWDQLLGGLGQAAEAYRNRARPPAAQPAAPRGYSPFPIS